MAVREGKGGKGGQGWQGREREGEGGEGGQGWQGRVRVAREGEGEGGKEGQGWQEGQGRQGRAREGDSGDVPVSSEVSVEWIGEDGGLAPACAASWEQSWLCPSRLKRAASMTIAWLGWLLPPARLTALAKI